MTIQNLGSKTEVLNLLPNDVLASTAVGSAVDIQTFEGSAAIMLLAEAGGSGIVYTIKLTECDTSGGTYTDVTGGAFTATTANTASVQKIYLNLSELKQYLKVSSTVSGGTGAGAVAVVGLGSKKYS
jgi:hypothetical protein